MSAKATPIRTQAERSAETKARLIDAAVECLIERGYAYATTVEICSRAALTRGAYNHHYSDAHELFADVLRRLYERLGESGTESDANLSLEELIRRGWMRAKRPELKAVIEIWLASRNDPELGESLAPEIAKLSQLFDPGYNSGLNDVLDGDAASRALYRLAFEATIGLALGRATSPAGAPVAHEDEVIELLLSLARKSQKPRA